MSTSTNRTLAILTWIAAAIFLALLLAIALTEEESVDQSPTPPDYEFTPGEWVEPYGGCDEAWMAPNSIGAEECRDHGWVVHDRFVLDPNTNPAYINLPDCDTEDGGGLCYWDADGRGNESGQSFIIEGQRDGKHRIWWVGSGETSQWKQARLKDGWTPIGRVHGHVGCLGLIGPTTMVECPDGYTTTS
jgi:hypothetical protein